MLETPILKLAIFKRFKVYPKWKQHICQKNHQKESSKICQKICQKSKIRQKNCKKNRHIHAMPTLLSQYMMSILFKGQLISKGNFGVYKKINEIFVRISALATKKGFKKCTILH